MGRSGRSARWLLKKPSSPRFTQSSKRLLFAADETTESLALPPTAIKLVGPAALRPDEPLRLIVVLPEGQRRGLLAIDGEDSVVSRRFSAQGRVGLVVIDHPPRCAGHLTIGVVTLDVLSQGAGDRRGPATSQGPENRTTLATPFVLAI